LKNSRFKERCCVGASDVLFLPGGPHHEWFFAALG
jgi:hypothetical protein